MMKVLCGAVLSALLLAAGRWAPPASGPPREQFKQAYVSPEGRVIDPSDARKISTSEGQSYGLFFALGGQRSRRVRQTADWTQNNWRKAI